MADHTSKIAGNYPGGYRMTCILDEGAATVSSASMNQGGNFQKVAVYATPLVEGDIVALSNDAANELAATGGIPVFERPVAAESPVIIGQIVSEPELQTFPTTATSDTLANRLTYKTYRVAEVEIWGGVTKITKANVTGLSGTSVLPGASAKLKIDVSDGVGGVGLNLIVVASGGATGIIPLTALADNSNADQYSALVAIIAGTFVTVA